MLNQNTNTSNKQQVEAIITTAYEKEQHQK